MNVDVNPMINIYDMIYFIMLLGIILLYLYSDGMIKEGYVNEESLIINPTYLKNDINNLSYSESIIEKQRNENRELRSKIKQLAEKIDDMDGNNIWNDVYYRRKLSNKYYTVSPHMSGMNDDYLNLAEDDFSGKTLSTIKFLSQTRSSKFFDNNIEFPSELCGNFCATDDKNAKYNENIDMIRPTIKLNK